MDILNDLQKYTDFSSGKSKERIEIKYIESSFQNLRFTGFDLNNTEFLEVTFSGCDFTNVYLSGSNLSGSIFKKCIFKNNIFRKGKAEYVIFDQTDINNMDAFRSSFYEASFNDIVIVESQIANCFFSRSSFSNTVFKNVDLTSTNFSHAKFNNVKFVECILDKTNFENAIGLESVEFLNTSL